MPSSPRHHQVMIWPILTMWSVKRPDLAITFWSQTGVFSMRTPRNVTPSRWAWEPMSLGPLMLNSIIVGRAYSQPQ